MTSEHVPGNHDFWASDPKITISVKLNVSPEMKLCTIFRFSCKIGGHITHHGYLWTFDRNWLHQFHVTVMTYQLNLNFLRLSDFNWWPAQDRRGATLNAASQKWWPRNCANKSVVTTSLKSVPSAAIVAESIRTLLDAAVCFVVRHVFLMSASVVLTQPGCKTLQTDDNLLPAGVAVVKPRNYTKDGSVGLW